MTTEEVTEQVLAMGKKARAAALELAILSADQKNEILRAMAQGLREHAARFWLEMRRTSRLVKRGSFRRRC